MSTSPHQDCEARAQGYLGHPSVPIASHWAGHGVDLGAYLLNNLIKNGT